MHRPLSRDAYDPAAACHLPAPAALSHHRPVRFELGVPRAERGGRCHEAHRQGHLRQVPQRCAQLRVGAVGKRCGHEPAHHARDAGGRFPAARERGAADEVRRDEGGGRGGQRAAGRRGGRGAAPVGCGHAGLLRATRPDRRHVRARRLAAHGRPHGAGRARVLLRALAQEGHDQVRRRKCVRGRGGERAAHAPRHRRLPRVRHERSGDGGGGGGGDSAAAGVEPHGRRGAVALQALHRQLQEAALHRVHGRPWPRRRGQGAQGRCCRLLRRAQGAGRSAPSREDLRRSSHLPHPSALFRRHAHRVHERLPRCMRRAQPAGGHRREP